MIELISTIFLMGPTGEEGGGDSMMPLLMMMGAIFLVMYFFMIRPQVKKAKKQREFQEGLKKGDKIVTAGGIHGKIDKVNGDGTLLVEVDSGVKLKMERSVVSIELSGDSEESK